MLFLHQLKHHFPLHFVDTTEDFCINDPKGYWSIASFSLSDWLSGLCWPQEWVRKLSLPSIVWKNLKSSSWNICWIHQWSLQDQGSSLSGDFITNSVSLLVTGLFRLLVPLWFSLGRLCVPRNLSFSSRLSNFLASQYSVIIPFISAESTVMSHAHVWFQWFESSLLFSQCS